MLFHLDFHVEYGATMTQQDLFATWSREAAVALDAKHAGVVVDLWKCAGSGGWSRSSTSTATTPSTTSC